MEAKPADDMESSSPLISKGEYIASTSSDTRGPCPMLNTLANHGYISRSGREFLVKDLIKGLEDAGVGPVLADLFSQAVFLERKHPDPTKTQPPRSWLGSFWYLVTHPWSILLSKFGMRDQDQKDAQGVDCLDLNQLAAHGIVEHDVSLSRHDIGQGDNITLQPEFVHEMLACSSDGKVLTVDDFAKYKRLSIQRQKRDNPSCRYDKFAHTISCGEMALVLNLFGDGKQVPCEYIRSFFLEERLPIPEGWKSWTQIDGTSFGVIAFKRKTDEMKAAMGLDIQ